MKRATVKKTAQLPATSEWSFDAIDEYHEQIARVAKEFGLDVYPPQIELITAEQMMDAYASVGMPVNYHHWSFGKHFLSTEKSYRRGQMGLAYEIVINSNPCIAYLMEENTLTMQALVIAHAAYGHNSFFKGNYLFQTWTNADAIIDYLIFARHYIAECEERYGEEEVELLLDSCHALMNLGVDRYKRPPKLSLAKEKLRQAERTEYLQSQVNQLWRTLPVHDTKPDRVHVQRFPPEPEENLLYFVEKHAPLLEPWQREIVRIVRKIAQYLSPKIMRDFRLFAILDDEHEPKLKVSAIHDSSGYRRVREILSDQYNLGSREPNIQVWNVDLRGDRSLTLRHQQYRSRPLGGTADEVMKHMARLWGFTVRLETQHEDGTVELAQETRIEKRRGHPEN